MTEAERKSDDLFGFVEKTMLNSFMKIAGVNLLTGEYRFLKREQILRDVDLTGISSIYTYIEKQVKDKLVLSEYADEYLKFADPGYVQKRVFGGEKRILQRYTRKAGDRYIWVTFSIVATRDCSVEKPWAVFTWQEADPDTTTMMDALFPLSSLYYKILKINLTRDSFECFKVDLREQEQYADRLQRISEWWDWFAKNGEIFPEDEKSYRQFTDLDRLRACFREEKAMHSCRYRRWIGDEFRWVQMDLVPSAEYRDENQVVLLYVKDIQEEYLRELQSRRELVDSYNRDALTLLYNRHKYNEDLENLKEDADGLLTCLYVDVNGLHELNNKLGHEKGDTMLCSVADALRKFFPEERIYRIGGDEFVMLSTRLSRHSVEQMIPEMRRDLDKDYYEISVGVESGSRKAAVYQIVGAAELAMRADKELYYKRKGDRRKNREIDKELERMLAEKQDAETFLKVIATKFAGVYFVNMKSDTLRHIYIPTYFLQLLEQTNYCFSEAIRLYAARFVKEEYQALFFKASDYVYLSKRLRQAETVQFSYQKVDGTWMNLRITGVGAEEKQECIWIFLDEKAGLYEKGK